MRYAFAYGADAVYAGLPRYSLRVRNNAFDGATLGSAVTEAHAEGKRFYLAANILSRGSKLKSFIADLEPIVAMAPDALIMADPGLIMLVRKRWPDQAIHLSVQANTTNSAAVRFWAAQGISRVILSRELSLDEVAEIRDTCPDVELEVFVHGALCIAYSGRCLLSGYFNHRDANQGACTNACRWDYRVASTASTEPLAAASDPAMDATGGMSGEITGATRHPAADEVYLLEERERPGSYLPIFEDEEGTYILNSRDLRAVEHVARLVSIGIDSLKIEGRTKSHYYVARTAQVYRAAIDDALAGRAFRSALLTDLEGLANRGYTEGFYRRHAPSELQNYDDGASRNQRQIFVGEVTGSRDGWVDVTVKNRFAVGDELELLTPAGNHRFRLESMRSVDDAELQLAPGDGWRVRIPVPPGVPSTPERHALLTRALHRVLNPDLNPSRDSCSAI
ncbi:prephenate-dependent tRNA uridine(34) hydroxylase TrhP [Thiocapsa bogorovii]|uniref:prephenate-dependent tRNA uridine(34) hydroxylase TrhP n=1 Tax=Thiocapsa bogorovii TaxID=521689 RepID=UPI001E5138DF|nr:tRNA 5-hydroxyuridine modification protein YegQ [Thiocapsa bogorovii]